LNQNCSVLIPFCEFPGRVTVEKDSARLVELVVDLLEDRLRRRLSQLDPKPLGLATGRTIQPIYTALVSRLRSWPKADLEKLLGGWCSFNLDEYIGLVEGSPDSFAAYMARYLGDPLGLTFDQLRIPNGCPENPQKEASSYVKQLKLFGGLGTQLLGLGINGHIGFNEPPCSSHSSCRVVPLSASTRKQNAFSFGNDPNLVPTHAITLGIEEILFAEEIHLIVTGASKANILHSFINKSASECLPASWLRQHNNLFLWCDYAAFSKVR